MSAKLTELFAPKSLQAHDDSKMDYTRLGRSGLKISRVILGAMSYGEPDQGVPWTLPEDQALPLLYHAFQRGINTWDTADVYSQRTSELIIAKAIKEYQIPRSRLVLLTKCYFGVDPEIVKNGLHDNAMSMTNDGHMVNRVGLSRKHIFDAVDASVARLGTYIDMLQIHRLDHETPPEEIMRALNDVVESGKVRYIGASSMAAWELQMLNNLAEKQGWHKFIRSVSCKTTNQAGMHLRCAAQHAKLPQPDLPLFFTVDQVVVVLHAVQHSACTYAVLHSMQNYHNLIYREEEREMHPYCDFAGIGLIPWSPLASGILARPWSDLGATKRAQLNTFLSHMYRDEDKPIIDRVEEVSKKLGRSMASVAIAWSLKKGVNPILGLSSVERIDEAVEAVRLALSEEDIAALDEPYKARSVAPLW